MTSLELRENKMKDWQKGYELEKLIEWTNKFEDYNKYCHSPFAKAKKNGMASSLEKGLLSILSTDWPFTISYLRV